MLTEEEIKSVIVARMEEAKDSRNAEHRLRILGQIHTLLYVLNDKVYREQPLDSFGDVIKASGIPYEEVSEGKYAGLVKLKDDWLREHGFEIELDENDPMHDILHHPRFSESW